MINLTDEILVAYVDGELPAETQLQVETLIALDAAAQAKVKDMRDTAELLRAAFAEADQESVEEAERESNVVQLGMRPRRGYLTRPSLVSGLAAAAAILLLIGGGLLKSPLHGNERADFMADVAAYHSVYAQETEHLAEVPASRKDHIEEWLGARIGRTLAIPDLTGEGWAFEGGRLLAEADKPIAQLLYTAPGRQPIALCITQFDQPETPPTQYQPGHGMRVSAWDADGYLYIIVGALPESELDVLTETVRSHFHTA
jgi:anti-sigma factor RsiW